MCGAPRPLVEPVALALHRDDLGMGEEAIEDGGGRRRVAEELAPVLRGSVRGISPSWEGRAHPGVRLLQVELGKREKALDGARPCDYNVVTSFGGRS